MCAGSVADANDTWMNHLDQYPPGWEEEDMMVDEDRLYIQGDFQLNRRWPNKELVYVIDPTLEECRTQIDTAIQQVSTNKVSWFGKRFFFIFVCGEAQTKEYSMFFLFLLGLPSLSIFSRWRKLYKITFLDIFILM